MVPNLILIPENIDSSPVNVLFRSETKHALAIKPSDKTSDDDGPTTATEMFPFGL